MVHNTSKFMLMMLFKVTYIFTIFPNFCTLWLRHQVTMATIVYQAWFVLLRANMGYLHIKFEVFCIRKDF